MITRRLWTLFLFTAAFTLLGLCLGRQIYYLAAAVSAMAVLFGLLNAVLLKTSLRIDVHLREKEVRRGEKVHMRLDVAQRCPFPAAEAAVVFFRGGRREEAALEIHPFHTDSMDVTAAAQHVGNESFTVESVSLTDIFGLFRVSVKSGEGKNVLVLPRPFEIEKPDFLISDEGRTALRLAQEDNTSPEDIRDYIPGDALKRIHWKLSARRGELAVRRYETPAPPDTLILMDNARPEETGEKDGDRVLRDLLCETCAAVADLQLRDASPVRVPMYGDAPGEFTADAPDHSLLLQEMLAAQPFDFDYPFERVLQLELRRMRRTGAVIVITARLTPEVAEGIISMRRMGPSVRLYLASLRDDAASAKEMIARLQNHLVEVCYVTPC